MDTKIAFFQFNPSTGDIDANTQAIVNAAEEAKKQGAHVLITPELALTGSPLEDLLFKPSFWQQVRQGLDKIEALDDIAVVVGHPFQDKGDCYNSASVFLSGNRLGIYHKMILSNDGVSDEVRYFNAGVHSLVFKINQIHFGLLIGDDTQEVDPAAEVAELGADVLLCLNASPFYLNRQQERLNQLSFRATENNLPICSINKVGGQDELVFDGQSFALNAQGALVYQAQAFQNSLDVLTMQKDTNNTINIEPHTIADNLSEDEMLYQAIVMGTRDYIQKSGFKKICLGLSGGIDSALVLAVAVDAIGAENCEVIIMPSNYTASISTQDAETMAKNLKVKYSTIAISPLFEQFKKDLAPLFNDLPEDTTEENLQARIRGTLLMALSNKSGALLLTTGNKSELATGYCTLYGDMNGGFAVIKDLLKTQVFELSRYRNTISSIIPERIIERPPSAELRADQTDQDSLPEYDVLDPMLTQIMEHNADKADLIKQGFHSDEVNLVCRLVKINEYKRRQGAIGPKVSRRAFGKDWRMPICHRFTE